MRMNIQRGFVTIPVLIAVVVGVLAVGTAGYVVVSQPTKETYDSGPTEQTASVSVVATSTATSTEEVTENEEVDKEGKEEKETNQFTKQADTTSTPSPQSANNTASVAAAVEEEQVDTTNQEETLPEDFSLSCEPARDKVNVGDNVEIALNVDGNTGNYDIEWDDKHLVLGQHTELGTFRVDSLGKWDSKRIEFVVQVTRKPDGLGKKTSCSILVKKNSTLPQSSSDQKSGAESEENGKQEESPQNTEQNEPESKITIKLLDAATHLPVGNGLKTARVKFEIISESGQPIVLFDPKLEADAGEYEGSGLQYWPTGKENEGYQHIDPKIAGTGADTFTFDKSGEPYVFMYYVSYSAPVLYFDFTVDLEVVSYEGDAEPIPEGFPLTGSYDTCSDLSNLYEVRVLCGTE